MRGNYLSGWYYHFSITPKIKVSTKNVIVSNGQLSHNYPPTICQLSDLRNQPLHLLIDKRFNALFERRLQLFEPVVQILTLPIIHPFQAFGQFYIRDLRQIDTFQLQMPNPGCPSIHYGFMYGYQDILLVSFLIRISAGQCSFTALRSFSQLVTSFFGVKCQGIHPTLFVA